MDSQLMSEALEGRLFVGLPEKEKKMCRKLTLWHTPTLAPIFTHNKLEPIMASINFFPLKKELQVKTGTTSAGRENDGINVELEENSQEHNQEAVTGTKSVKWREYRFISMNMKKVSGLDPEMRPRPRLPYPRVDGMHLKSYLAFFAALECYIDPHVVQNLFHIRATPMDSRDEIYKTVYREIMKFHLYLEIEGLVRYFYREDTLDDASEEIYGQLKASVGNEISKMYVRKDGTRKIEEDERDDTSDFVCLIDKGDALCADGDHGELSRDESVVGDSDDLRRDDRENSEACCSSSFVNLSDLIGGG